ncbi:MAG: thiamine phosphate synthase [Defluviicoccus sp.]|nr:MAG: thiamine phosphate synthase [Defluviicoccus sp.]
MPSLAEVARRLQPQPALGATRARPLPRLLLMTDSDRLPDPEKAVRALPPGTGVILRERDVQRRKVLAARLAPLCRRRRRRLILLIAADWRLACHIGADGVHLSEAVARSGPRRWQAIRQRGLMVTTAAHSPRALRRAGVLGLDAVLLSPVAVTGSHPLARPLGPLRFARWAALSPLPIYALGGITTEVARRLLPARPAGFAAIDALIPQHHDEPSALPSILLTADGSP